MCDTCDTTYRVDLDPGERLLIDVIGPTCADCNHDHTSRPDRPAAAAPPPQQGPAQVITARWSNDPDRPQTLQIQKVVRVDPSADPRFPEDVVEDWRPPSAPPEPVPDPAGPDPDDGLRQRAARALNETLGADLGERVAAAWEPKHCEKLVELAGLFQRTFAMDDCDPTDGLRISVRLTDAPPLVNVIIGEVVARGLNHRDERPLLWKVAYILDGTATVLCLAIGEWHDCAARPDMVAYRGGPVTNENLASLIERWFRPVLAARPAMQSASDLLRSLYEHGDRLDERVPVRRVTEGGDGVLIFEPAADVPGERRWPGGGPIPGEDVAAGSAAVPAGVDGIIQDLEAGGVPSGPSTFGRPAR